jgi:HEAT repeat protein
MSVNHVPAILGLAGVVFAQDSRPAPTKLEARVLAALASEDPVLRAQAASLLGVTGDQRHVAAVGPLVDDGLPHVRTVAIGALANLMQLDPAARAGAAPWLLRASKDAEVSVRQQATWALHSCAPRESWPELAAGLGDPALGVRVASAMSLARLGAKVPADDVAALLQACAGLWYERQVVHALDLVVDPAKRDALAPLLASDDPYVRERAEEARARLDAVARGEAAPKKTPGRDKRERFDEDAATAQRALRALPWRAVERAELLRAVKDARLVLFGEFHSPEGPLRDAQCELLREWAGKDKKHEAVGYEPSVEKAQRLVIAAAEELGIEARSLERNWRVLQSLKRYAERDDEAAEAINGFLAEDPRKRMFVIRGESHVLPDGYLVRQLAVPPVIVLCGMGTSSIPLHALGEELRWVGRTFRLGDSGRVFVVGCYDQLDAGQAGGLREWVEKR